MSLREYAAGHPVEELPESTQKELKKARASMDSAKQKQDDAEALKASIVQQLTEKNNPELILGTALRCIAVLTKDPDFESYCLERLEETYKDFKQLSFLQDNANQAAERLRQQREAFIKNSTASITRQQNALKKTMAVLNELSEAINALQFEQDVSETFL